MLHEATAAVQVDGSSPLLKQDVNWKNIYRWIRPAGEATRLSRIRLFKICRKIPHDYDSRSNISSTQHMSLNGLVGVIGFKMGANLVGAVNESVAVAVRLFLRTQVE